MLRETIETNQQGISGESGCRGIRRISIGWRIERQDLPESLARFGQEVEKFVDCWAKVTDAST